jgi:hypothetical protein
MNRPEAPRRALRASLLAGAAYDLALGLFILVLGPPVMTGLGSPIQGSTFLFRLAALPLFVLPVLYAVAARSPAVDAFRPAVLWARGGGGAFILALTAILHPGAAGVFTAIGLVDLGWAAIHALLWRTPPSAPADAKAR